MGKTTIISFPGLGIGEFEVSKVAFRVFGVSIAWYALIITLGMLVCATYIIWRVRKIGLGIEETIDYTLVVIPIGILGARLYYVLMKLNNYHSFLDVINIRDGGLAIYGGIIAGGLTVLAICMIKKIYFPALADCVSPGVIIAQSIGRWGNFMNGEAYGYETDIFCRMGLDFGYGMRYYHPTFLYESLWNLLGFILINIFYKHKKYDGQIFLLVFGWYGLGRMLIEGLRTDSLYLFGTGIRVSQALAGVIFTLCLAALIYFAVKPPKRKLYFREKQPKKENK